MYILTKTRKKLIVNIITKVLHSRKFTTPARYNVPTKGTKETAPSSPRTVLGPVSHLETREPVQFQLKYKNQGHYGRTYLTIYES